jgi:hypothetical protein
MARAKNCCGFGQNGSVIRAAGLFFFVFPAYAVFSAAAIPGSILAGFGAGTAAPAGFWSEMRRVSLAMLNDSFACKARCALSCALVGFSPALAGAVYKYLNPALMALCWTAVLAALI